MNGAGTRKGYGYEPGRLSPPQAAGGGGRNMMEGYRKEILNGFEREKPRYNPMNAGRVQSSPLVDLKDPIQVHLLTETALLDSKQWEILSQEEVDDLKKQIQSLTQRITQTRANLAIQSKYRDAAISMAKLYSPASKRRSILGNRGSGGDTAREAEAERQACEKRCEELASELFSLEKRAMEPQRRLLQHTAGILQLTHAASKKQAAPPNGQPVNGIPGSPESLYTYTTGDRDSFEPSPEDSSFDDGRNPFTPLDQGRGQNGGGRGNPQIPLKSPVRKETQELRETSNQLREENSRLQAESVELRASNDALNMELDALQRENDEQLDMIADTEKRVEELSNRVREVIIRFNPSKNKSYKIPPSGKVEPGDLLASQLKYLDDGLVAVQEEQELSSSISLKENESAVAAVAAKLATAQGQVESFNRQLRDILRTVDPGLPPPPEPSSGAGVEDQIDWLQDTLIIIQSEVVQGNQQNQQKAEEVDAVLMGLWDLIQSGFASIQREKEQRKRTRSQKGLTDDDDDDDSDDSPFTPNETYSLQAFPTKIQWLYTQATKLMEQKSVLQRQIKQQRELNTKSDSEKDAQLRSRTEELARKEDALQRSEREVTEARGEATESRAQVKDAQEKLARAVADLEAVRKTSALNDGVSDQLKERNAKYAALENESKDLVTQLSKVEAEIGDLTLQLNDATEAKLVAETNAEKAAKEVKEKDEEVERLNIMVIELKTEVTFAKAELDGAYGSRAERAADVAQLAATKENAELQAQADKLKAELASTLKEFEGLTKDTITAEREKLELEGKLDDALASKASLESEGRALQQRLEAEVASLKEELDAERLKVAPASGGGTSRAGASMLSEQFRATMKEERRKFQEELRAEQTTRRKLEDEVRVLKRAAGPGKSPLSPR